jgi:hypothetical protein
MLEWITESEETREAMSYSQDQAAVARTAPATGTVLKGAKASSPEQLAALVEARQNRLASDIDELVGRLQPTAVAVRSARTVNAKVRETFWTEGGALRMERVAAAGIGLTAFLALVIRIARRKR